MQNGAVGIQVDCPLKEGVRPLEPAGGFLRDPTLHQRFEILGIRSQALLEVVEPALENPTLPVRDLQISPRHTHPLVERQRARERDDRFVRQSLSEIQDSEVVVRARVRRIDSAREGPQDVDLTAMRGCRWAGSCRWAHRVSLRAPRGKLRRMRCDLGRAGRIRAGSPPAPRGRTPSPRKGSATRLVARDRQGREAHGPSPQS